MDSIDSRRDGPERVVVLDTETTGRSAETGRIVEIGCVEVVGSLITGNTFHTYVNPAGVKVEEGARAVHGLTDEFLARQPKFRDIQKKFFDFVGSSPLVIHNASFDMAFINMERRLLGLPPMPNEVRDTLSLARLKWPGQRASLDALCTRLGVDNSRRHLHGALIDADLLAQVYIKMMGLDMLRLEMDPSAAKPTEHIEVAAAPIRRMPRPARPPLLPTPEEEASFSAFVATSIRDSLWARNLGAETGIS